MLHVYESNGTFWKIKFNLSIQHIHRTKTDKSLNLCFKMFKVHWLTDCVLKSVWCIVISLSKCLHDFHFLHMPALTSACLYILSHKTSLHKYLHTQKISFFTFQGRQHQIDLCQCGACVQFTIKIHDSHIEKLRTLKH